MLLKNPTFTVQYKVRSNIGKNNYYYCNGMIIIVIINIILVKTNEHNSHKIIIKLKKKHSKYKQ